MKDYVRKSMPLTAAAQTERRPRYENRKNHPDYENIALYGQTCRAK
jgi:hypothetical protein